MEDYELSTPRNNQVIESFEAVWEVTPRALQHHFRRILFHRGRILTCIRIGQVSRADKFLANSNEYRKTWSIVLMQGAQRGRLWSTLLLAQINKSERSNECQSVRIKVLENPTCPFRVASETIIGIQLKSNHRNLWMHHKKLLLMQYMEILERHSLCWIARVESKAMMVQKFLVKSPTLIRWKLNWINLGKSNRPPLQ